MPWYDRQLASLEQRLEAVEAKIAAMEQVAAEDQEAMLGAIEREMRGGD